MGARGLAPPARDGDAGGRWGVRGQSPGRGRGALVPHALAPREDEAFAAASGLSGGVSGEEEASVARGAERRGDRWAGAALGTLMAP